jgi:hypothetical protein
MVQSDKPTSPESFTARTMSSSVSLALRLRPSFTYGPVQTRTYPIASTLMLSCATMFYRVIFWVIVQTVSTVNYQVFWVEMALNATTRSLKPVGSYAYGVGPET